MTMEENKRKEYLVKETAFNGTFYVVYNEEWEEIGRYDDLHEAEKDHPDAR